MDVVQGPASVAGRREVHTGTLLTLLPQTKCSLFLSRSGPNHSSTGALTVFIMRRLEFS